MNRERYQHIFVMLREEIKSTDSVEWFTFKQMRQDVEVMNANGMMSYVHEQMQDFYKEEDIGGQVTVLPQQQNSAAPTESWDVA